MCRIGNGGSIIAGMRVNTLVSDNWHIFVVANYEVGAKLNTVLPDGYFAWSIKEHSCGNRWKSITFLTELKGKQTIQHVKDSFLTMLVPTKENQQFINAFYRKYPSDP